MELSKKPHPMTSANCHLLLPVVEAEICGLLSGHISTPNNRILTLREKGKIVDRQSAPLIRGPLGVWVLISMCKMTET